MTLNGDGTFNGVHAPGDVLLRGNFTASGVLEELLVSEWVGDGSGDEGNGNVKSIPTTGVDCVGADPGDDFCATTNLTCTQAFPDYIPAHANGCAAGEYPPVSFQEGGINVTKALQVTGVPCFNSFMIMSRSSTSVRSQLKDFILGGFPTCGTIKIVKDTVPNGPQDFTFTDDIADCTVGPLDDDADGTLSNMVTCFNVPFGQYTVTENAASGYDLTAISCDDGNSTGNTGTRTATINVEIGETVTCTFTNEARGTIKIIKDTVPNDPQNFTYTENIPNCTIGPLDDDSDGTLSNMVTCSNVPVGQYTVTEADPTPGFDLTNLACVDSDTGGTASTVNLGTRKATINLDPGETVTCTYTNTKRGTIVIIKDTVPNAAQDFSYTDNISGCTVGPLDDDSDGTLSNTVTCNNVVPGSYTVIETAATGYATTLVCVETNGDGGSTPSSSTATLAASIDLDAGETVTCTFTNTALPDLKVEKVGLIRYTITVTNNGPGATDTWELTDVLPGSNGPDPIWSITSTVPSGITCNIDSDNDLTCTTTTLELANAATFQITVQATIQDLICTSTLVSNTADIEETSSDDYDSSNDSYTVLLCD